MNRIYVKPAAGRIVPLPVQPGTAPRLVPSAGMWVTEDVFITRRLRDGDLVVAIAPAADDAPALAPPDTLNAETV